jgi:hypothetical protein
MNRKDSIPLNIDRPIFIVGCGRSGTTLLYDILCGHDDLAWFSNYTNRAPYLPILAELSRTYPRLRGRGVQQRLTPKPNEGYRIWDACRALPLAEQNRPLGKSDATPDEAEKVRRVIASHLRFQNRPRFLNKNTRNTRRIDYIASILPQAIFVHILRDPRAVVASLLQARFWPFLQHWWQDDLTTAELLAAGNFPEHLGALLWMHEVRSARQAGMNLAQQEYIEVHYEELVLDPQLTLEHLLTALDLPSSPRFTQFINSFVFRADLDGFQNRLNSRQLQNIADTVGEYASKVGYDIARVDT